MPGKWEQVHKHLWTDPDFVKLGPWGKLLFLWSWTNPGAALCGLYVASEKQMARGIGATPEQLREALSDNSRKPLLRYDADAEVLWVVTRARWANRSPKVAIAMQREVEACPSTPLLPPFLDAYGESLNLRLID